MATESDLAAVGTTACGADDAYLQTADIALSGPWTPISPSFPAFTGTFDGGRHVISGLDASGSTYRGLFGHVGGGAATRRVTVSGTANGDLAGATGGLVGWLENIAGGHVAISDVQTDVGISGGGVRAGGLIGWAQIGVGGSGSTVELSNVTARAAWPATITSAA